MTTLKGKGSGQLVGKRGELFVFGELLQRGLVPHLPLVDVEGVDALVPVASGAVLKLQIKTVATPRSPRWFQVNSVPDDKYLFYPCLEMRDGRPADIWLFPASVFDAYASRPPKGSPRDLNLDATRRGDLQPLMDVLSGFRNRWQLLTRFDEYQHLLDHPEDLTGLLATQEAMEAPEEEAITLEQYERGLFGVPS